MMVTTGSSSQHPSCSVSHSKSQDNSHSSTLGPQSHHIHAECLRDIDTHLAALNLDATHCHVANLHKEAIDATCCDAGYDTSTAALVNTIKLQTQVIEKQNAQHVMDTQLHNHLKTQLANRSHPHVLAQPLNIGMVLYMLRPWMLLKQRQPKKKVEEEEKQWQKEQTKAERQH